MYASLYEHVGSGVARVKGGLVRYANPAAVTLIGCTIGQRVEHPLLADMITAADNRLLALPLQFDFISSVKSTPTFCDPGIRPDLIATVIVAAPGHADSLLVILNRRSPTPQADTPLARFIAQIAIETTALLGQSSQPLSNEEPAAGTAPIRAFEGAREVLHDLHRNCLKIQALAEVLGRSHHEADERIIMWALVDRATQSVNALAIARNVTIALVSSGLPSPAVYGSNAWLGRAMVEYLEHSIDAAAPGSTIELSISATGTRALVCARTVAKPAADDKAERIDRATPPTRRANTFSLSLGLCQRIVEQHGGSVRIEDEFDMVDIVVDLPAGAPATGNMRLSVEQATRFAMSVAELRARRLTRAGQEPVTGSAGVGERDISPR